MRDIILRNRRLAILRFLAEEPDYSMNTSVLQTALAHIGHGVSRDRVEADCAWLAEQGLCDVNVLDIPVTVVRGTARGIEVARGLAFHPGVDRPLPR